MHGLTWRFWVRTQWRIATRLRYYKPEMLLLDERITADGTHARTWASCAGDRFALRSDGGVDDGAIGELGVAVVDQVMRRYGRPLDDSIALEGDSLSCGSYSLRRLRFHAAVDAEGRDYLVWQHQGEAPLVCVAATVTAALLFLVGRSDRWARGAPSGI